MRTGPKSMENLKLRPALLILVLASASMLGLLSGAEEMQFQEAFLGTGGVASWSPDGAMLATCSGREIVLVNAVDGSVLGRFAGHAAAIHSIEWSPDGSRLASGASDKTLRIWDAASGDEQLIINCQDAVSSVAWSPDGRLVAATQGNAVTVWDIQPVSKVASFEENVTALHCVAWSPDGARLVAGGARNFAMLYDTATWARSYRLSGLTGDVRSVAWSQDGTRLVTGDDKSVRIWNVTSGALVRSLVSSADARLAHSVAWSPDGASIAASLELQRTPIWNSTTGKVVQTIPWYGEHLDFSPDGSRLAMGTAGTVSIYGVSGGPLLRTLTGHGDSVYSVSWSPDGRRLATASGDLTVKTWDIASGALLATYGHAGPVRSVSWSPDGSRIASASDNGSIKIWDPDSLVELGTLNGTYPVAWSPDGRTLASSGAIKGSVILWEVSSGAILNDFITTAGTVSSIAWSPDGRRIATSFFDPSAGSQVYVLDAATGEELANRSESSRTAESPIDWSPDGRMLAAAVSSFNISVMDTGDWAIPASVGFAPNARTVSWCPDGERVAYSIMYNILVWDTSMSAPYVTFGRPAQGAGAIINALAWSPVDLLLASGCQDGSVMIWGPIGAVPHLSVKVTASPSELWSGEKTDLTIAVTDGSGNPVPSAKVTVSSREGHLSSPTEMGDGNYLVTFTTTEVKDNTTLPIAVRAMKDGLVPGGAAVQVSLVANHAPVIIDLSIAGGLVIDPSKPVLVFAEAVDPDGDPIAFSWQEGGGVLSTDVSFTQRFAPGEHTLVLMVSDGHTMTAKGVTFSVNAPPASQAAPVAVPAPVVAATAGVGVVLGLGAVFALAAEPGKYKLLTLLIIPLYSRINRDAALDHETRGMIRGVIIADPGIHYSEIIRRLDLRNGTAAYHLQTLEREGIIKSRNDGRFRRFYPAEMKFIGSHLRPTKLQKIILETVQEKEGMSQIDIAKTLDISYAIVHREIKRMSHIGMIRLQRHGISMKCFLAEEWQERLRLEKAEAADKPVRDFDAADG